MIIIPLENKKIDIWQNMYGKYTWNSLKEVLYIKHLLYQKN